jgi:hypothetical protein
MPELITDEMDPKTAAAGAQAQAQDPYAAMQELAEHGQLLQKAIPGLDPSVVMQGQQMGVDMSPNGVKKRLGAHEMISRGKKILRDEKKNSATGAAGSPADGNPAAAGQPPEQQPQPQQPPMVAAAKLHSIDMTKVARGLAAVGRASDKILHSIPKLSKLWKHIKSTSPTAEAEQKFLSRGKAPRAEPATEKKSSSDLGSGVKPLVHEPGFRTREGFKNTHRQEVFNDLAKWSLGAKTIG